MAFLGTIGIIIEWDAQTLNLFGPCFIPVNAGVVGTPVFLDPTSFVLDAASTSGPGSGLVAFAQNKFFALANDNSAVIGGVGNPVVFESIDGGSTWNSVNTGAAPIGGNTTTLWGYFWQSKTKATFVSSAGNGVPVFLQDYDFGTRGFSATYAAGGPNSHRLEVPKGGALGRRSNDSVVFLQIEGGVSFNLDAYVWSSGGGWTGPTLVDTNVSQVLGQFMDASDRFHIIYNLLDANTSLFYVNIDATGAVSIPQKIADDLTAFNTNAFSLWGDDAAGAVYILGGLGNVQNQLNVTVWTGTPLNAPTFTPATAAPFDNNFDIVYTFGQTVAGIPTVLWISDEYSGGVPVPHFITTQIFAAEFRGGTWQPKSLLIDLGPLDNRSLINGLSFGGGGKGVTPAAYLTLCFKGEKVYS